MPFGTGNFKGADGTSTRYRSNMKYNRKKRRYTRRKRVTNYSKENARPFPDSYKANLRYCVETQLDAAVGSFASATVYANSLFAPTSVTGSHQPMGFDELAFLYNRYLITGAKVTVTFTGDVSTGESQYVGLTIHNTAAFPGGTISTLVEQGKTVYRVLGPTDGDQNTVILTKAISMRKEFQVTDLSGNIDEYGALVTASPINGMFCSLWSTGMANEDPVECNALIKVEFTGYFTEPKLLSSS